MMWKVTIRNYHSISYIYFYIFLLTFSDYVERYHLWKDTTPPVAIRPLTCVMIAFTHTESSLYISHDMLVVMTQYVLRMIGNVTAVMMMCFS